MVKPYISTKLHLPYPMEEGLDWMLSNVVYDKFVHLIVTRLKWRKK